MEMKLVKIFRVAHTDHITCALSKKKKKNLTQTEETRKQRNITTDKTPVFLAVEKADQNSLDKHVRYTRDGTHRKHRSTTTLNLQHSVGQVDG